jgi:hypothetical protein
MRSSLSLCLALAALLALAPAGRAQLVIERVQLGFPSADRARSAPRLSYYKGGAWVPIVVWARAGDQAFPGGTLRVETTDSDDVLNRYVIDLPALKKGQRRTFCTFTKPGSVGARIALTVADIAGRKTAAADRDAQALDFGKLIFLTLGSAPADLPAALARLETDPDQRVRHAAHLGTLEELPTRWFGYDAADLVIFPTGNADFLRRLLADDTGRKEALAGWVRHGGHLVLSTSRNRGLVRKLLGTWDWRGADVLTGGAVPLSRVDGFVQFAEALDKPFESGDDSDFIGVARLRVRDAGPLEVLAVEHQQYPLIVRIPYGLGAVTLVAADLDRRPFTAWDGRREFWQKLIARVGPRLIPGGEDRNDVATDLQRQLEVFPGVEPVAFGWIAFLIFLYILLVGPLEYFFLARVIKRPGWTWALFPVTVVVISAAAFAVASGRHGDELRINQVDLVDIDMLGTRPHAVTTTWSSAYSPRIGTYSARVGPGWAFSDRRKEPAAVVSWLGRPELAGPGSTGRPRSQGLLRQEYVYAKDATGLICVPLPFASTKSFTASFEGQVAAPVTADLSYDRDNPDLISGGVTNRLPADLEGAVLFYGGKWYPFPEPLARGRRVELPRQTGREISQWHLAAGTPSAPAEGFRAVPLVNRLLFHERTSLGDKRRDNQLRPLDQSWRLRDPNPREVVTQEAILYGRLPRRELRADRMTAHPAAPARLALVEGAGGMTGQRPAPGTVLEETYARIYLPVRPGR